MLDSLGYFGLWIDKSRNTIKKSDEDNVHIEYKGKRKFGKKLYQPWLHVEIKTAAFERQRIKLERSKKKDMIVVEWAFCVVQKTVLFRYFSQTEGNIFYHAAPAITVPINFSKSTVWGYVLCYRHQCTSKYSVRYWNEEATKI